MDRAAAIKVAALPSEHVFKVNASANGVVTPLGGVEYKFLNLLSLCVGFSYEVVVPADGEYGSSDRAGRQTGLVGMVARGEADLALSMLALTEARSEVVDFSRPYRVDRTAFFTRPLAKTLAFVHPFHATVWLCVALAILLVAAALKVVFRDRRGLQVLCFRTLGSLLEQNPNLLPKNAAQRVLAGCWLACSTFLGMGYRVVLLSTMTVPTMPDGLTTVGDVAEAVAGGTHRCYLFDGTVDKDSFYSATEGPLADIARSVKRHNRLLKHGGRIEDYIPDSETVLVGSYTLVPLTYMNGSFRSYRASKEFFYNTLFSIPVKRGFCCLERLDKCLTRLSQTGLYEKYLEDETFRMRFRAESVNRVSSDSRAINMGELCGAFFLLLGGYLLGFMALFFEIAFRRKKKK